MTPDHFHAPPEWRPLDLGIAGGWSVWHVAETGSTNADLLAAADHGAPDHTVLVTDHQTAGRGRLDRRWDAPPGSNLLVSILFRPVPVDASQLTRRVGVAAVDAVNAVADVRAALKWPNDVLVDGAKLAGILAQRGADSVVVGMGLNVGWAPDGAAKLGEDVEPTQVLTALLTAFAAQPASVDDRYRELLDTLGRNVRVDLPDGTQLLGRAVDVASDGRLIVIDECASCHRLDVGDVVHVRPADGA